VKFSININNRDKKPPFTYGEKESPYGEINSLGGKAIVPDHISPE
jgi:hypothetical protein